jgi:hypothetical protein
MQVITDDVPGSQSRIVHDHGQVVIGGERIPERPPVQIKYPGGAQDEKAELDVGADPIEAVV